jgi:hypothetical protein
MVKVLLLLAVGLLHCSSALVEPQESLRLLGENLTSIHFIGDLHGDVHCAKYWVGRTGLVNLTSPSSLEWIGSENDALVFLGDYVDKGSTSSSVLSFIKSLQESFPSNVVSILGNHDFFQVLDTGFYFDQDVPHPLTHPFYEYSYSFVHPEEYLQSGFLTPQPDDDELLNATLSALQSIYYNNLQSTVNMCAPKASCKPSQLDMFTVTPPFDKDTELAERARDRIEQWRREYAQGLLDSGLLGWMARQPLVAVVGDALVVHGGVSKQVISFVDQVAEQHGVSTSSALHLLTNVPFSQFWETHIPHMVKANSVKERIEQGYVLEISLDMVQHRGYFKQNGCQEVEHVIGKIEGVERIVVGHTPRSFAEELCHGELVASDSTLSRTFRAYGNYYCPIDEGARQKIGDNQPFSRCEIRVKDTCEGSISSISRDSPSDAWPRNVKLLKADLNEIKMADSSHDEL